MSFDSLGLAEPLLRAVHEAGYTTPTPIQAQAIPAVLSGGDVMGGAQTGTGKTAGFVLPLLQRLMAKPAVRDARGKLPIRALILTPTRELAAQVEESVRVYGKHSKLTSMVMFGGVGMQPQIDKLRRGVDILVATPGRLLDHHGQRTLDLSHVEIFVLDEADRMLDMGFIHDIKKVLAVLPPKKQSLLFSATFSDEVKAIADRLLNAPVLIEVARRNQTAELVAQKVHPVGREMKKDLLTHLVKDNDWHQVLVFTRMKHGANRLVEHLLKQGITAMAIHGNKSQTARTKALADFKKGDAAGAGRDRHRRARHRHRPAAARRQLRDAERPRGLRAPHRPHRPRRLAGRGDLARLGRRERLPARHRAAHQARDPEGDHSRLRAAAHERPEPIVLGRMVIGEGAGRGGARPRRDGPGRGDSGRSSHGGARAAASARQWRRPGRSNGARQWRAAPTRTVIAAAAAQVEAAAAAPIAAAARRVATARARAGAAPRSNPPKR